METSNIICADPTREHRPDILFEFCKITDPRYKAIRDRHYVANAGSCGMQVHFLVRYKGEIVGIISAGSSVYAVAARDAFFKIPKGKENRKKVLVHILNNTVFRLETPDSIRAEKPDLTPEVLALWRKIISFVWLDLYGASVAGFETFVEEETLADGKVRSGKVYVADNWTFAGYTKGSAKSHRGLHNKQTRKKTTVKRIFVRRNDDAPYEVKLWSKWLSHQPSWAAKSVEEKARKKGYDAKRKYLTGRLFSYGNGEVWRSTDNGYELALASDCVAEEAAVGYLERRQKLATRATTHVEATAAD
jgi:Druantia protein DruA